MLAPEGVNLSSVPGGIGGATACVGAAAAVVAVVAGSEVAMMCAAVLLCTRCFLRAQHENPHQKDPVRRERLRLNAIERVAHAATSHDYSSSSYKKTIT